VSTSGNKRARAVCIKAYELSQLGLTNRQIAETILCRPEQVPGKVKAGMRAAIRDERQSAQNLTDQGATDCKQCGPKQMALGQCNCLRAEMNR
jgi:hypothetical protein